jgi:uncharacterized protein (DUF2252 family)
MLRRRRDGAKFWRLSRSEKADITELFQRPALRHLATSLRSRDDDAAVELLDAAYWMKGCSSLGLLRFAVLLGIGIGKEREMALMDIKEAVKAAAPRYAGHKIPKDQAERVVEGAMHLSPNLGKRMVAGQINQRSVFIRELMPQDLKIEIERFNGSGRHEDGKLLSRRGRRGSCATNGRKKPKRLVE